MMIGFFWEVPLLVTFGNGTLYKYVREGILSNVDKRDWLMMKRHLENTFDTSENAGLSPEF